MTDLNEIGRRLDRIDSAIEGLTLHGKAQTALSEQQMEQLAYLEKLTQICIDQGKGFSQAITQLNQKIDGLNQ